ncbi:MAG: hypothetical protein ACE37K_24585 [Planctomycetota bacterium]
MAERDDADRSYRAIAARIEACLREHLPDGFRHRLLDRQRGWVIEPPPTSATARPGEFGLWVTRDADWIVASYGNTDAGFDPPCTLQTLSLATELTTTPLPSGRDPLRTFLLDLIARTPNLWACT